MNSKNGFRQKRKALVHRKPALHKMNYKKLATLLSKAGTPLKRDL